MNKIKRSWKWPVAALVALGGGYLAYERFYAAPYRRLNADLTAALKANGAIEDELTDELEVRQGLRAFGEGTLGATEDVVKHRFRTALGEIGSACGLVGVSVNDGRPSKVLNPAGRSKLRGKVSSGLSSGLKKDADFYVIEGELKGTGALDRVLWALDTIRSQAWAHRVDGFSIKPVSLKDRERFELSVTVATMFAPDLAPRDAGVAPAVAMTDGATGRWRPIVEKNVFKEPPAPAVPAQAVAQAPPPTPPPSPVPPPAPAYGEWRLTGVTQGGSGVLAFMVNLKTDERLTLPQGGAVLDAAFVEGGGERAVFQIDGARFEVSNGETLAERRPLTG